MYYDDELTHWGIKGQKWGVRRWQNEDGTYNEAGKDRYFGGEGKKRLNSDANAELERRKSAIEKRGSAGSKFVNNHLLVGVGGHKDVQNFMAGGMTKSSARLSAIGTRLVTTYLGSMAGASIAGAVASRHAKSATSAVLAQYGGAAIGAWAGVAAARKVSKAYAKSEIKSDLKYDNNTRRRYKNK